MKLFVLSVMLIISLTPSCASAQLQQSSLTLPEVSKPGDETKDWTYPYQATDEKKQKLLDELETLKKEMLISEVVARLGKPDVIDDLRKGFRNLSHEESGMLSGNHEKISYRCVWYVRKYDKLPSLGDSWLAVYVGTDEKRVTKFMTNWLKR